MHIACARGSNQPDAPLLEPRRAAAARERHVGRIGRGPRPSLNDHSFPLACVRLFVGHPTSARAATVPSGRCPPHQTKICPNHWAGQPRGVKDDKGRRETSQGEGGSHTDVCVCPRLPFPAYLLLYCKPNDIYLPIEGPWSPRNTLISL